MANAKDFTKYLTSQHYSKPKYLRMVTISIEPFIECINTLEQLHRKYDVDEAMDPYLETLARWVGAPLIIPGVTELEYFGFIDQKNSLTFGELDNPSIGGYFRESGQSGTSGLIPKGDLLRRLIKAKILKNHSTGCIDETKEILKTVLNHDFFIVKDNANMTVSFRFLANSNSNSNSNAVQRRLVFMFFPLPVGVQLIIEE